MLPPPILQGQRGPGATGLRRRTTGLLVGDSIKAGHSSEPSPTPLYQEADPPLPQGAVWRLSLPVSSCEDVQAQGQYLLLKKGITIPTTYQQSLWLKQPLPTHCQAYPASSGSCQR